MKLLNLGVLFPARKANYTANMKRQRRKTLAWW